MKESIRNDRMKYWSINDVCTFIKEFNEKDDRILIRESILLALIDEIKLKEKACRKDVEIDSARQVIQHFCELALGKVQYNFFIIYFINNLVFSENLCFCSENINAFL